MNAKQLLCFSHKRSTRFLRFTIPSSIFYSSSNLPLTRSPSAALSPYTRWLSHCSLRYIGPATPKSYSYHISLLPSRISYILHPAVPHNSDHPHPAQTKQHIIRYSSYRSSFKYFINEHFLIIPFCIAKYFFITKHYNLNPAYNQYIYFFITNFQEQIRYAENQTRHGYRP